ncbi:hypothetical protein HPP92_024168 [Vanilla planifolia]|uniref:Uncharacterized protein n=1 Tax=Vanilla planifolia TaxID=51239 RepID=A0A835PMD9_VANPL|nr:hypothetical protein HPP92_024168 [Vanilla planifolia]
MAAATAARLKVDTGGKKAEISTSKQKSSIVASKSEVKDKGVAITTTKKSIEIASVKTKSQKKVYTLVGQKYDSPEEREPLRIFYESLLKQIPTSEMAEFWMMEHGLLSPERSKKAYEKKQRKQHQLRTATPVKAQKLDRPGSSKSHLSTNSDSRAKKRIKDSDDDNDDDFIVKLKKSKT